MKRAVDQRICARHFDLHVHAQAPRNPAAFLVHHLQAHFVAELFPQHAFEVFTTRIDEWWPEGHRMLTASVIAMEPGVGGRIFEQAADAEKELGRVVLWEPPSQVSYTWRPGAPEPLSTLVAIRFVAEGARTRVDVVHSEGKSGLGPDWTSRAVLFTAAWGHVLPALQDFITGESS